MSRFLMTEGKACPIYFVSETSFLTTELSPTHKAVAASLDFTGKAGQNALLYSIDGTLEKVLFGADKGVDAFHAGKLAAQLPAGRYEFFGEFGDLTLAVLGFVGAQYRFSRYKKDTGKDRCLKLSKAMYEQVSILLDGIFLARDLINTPANDMDPAALEQATRQIAANFGANIKVTAGEDLLRDNFPLIYHVGKASCVAPRLIDLTWGDASAPMVTLVGKGVCFDTGGLNIKPDHGMLLMKKDMGGAATALALAQMIMALGLKLRLRLLIPAVENAISGNAFRPSDIYPSRKGLSVEIGNTDAEGRLVLADALALADEEKPELIIDFATLTGAARVALGPDLPPFYTRDDKLAAELSAVCFTVNDPVWQMPLWKPYDSSMDGKISDLSSTGSLPFAGSITAAHFLNRFVTQCHSYLHFDIYAHVPTARTGRPFGGELQAARACLAMIQKRYS